jgi:sodium-dependent dicarboxylate transporter 2/3/5
MNKRLLGLIAGPLVFVSLLFFFQSESLSDSALVVLASAAWMAIWWVTEALPTPATALLPIVLFPLFSDIGISDAAAPYAHKYIYLFLGGFILASAMEKWNLHQRIALRIIHVVGTNQHQIILGFMMATAFLSMWISNTATAVMMMPIASAVIKGQVKDNAKKESETQFGKALMLGIAYSASIGGMATLIGTPPNLILAGVVEEMFEVEISFLEWMKIGLPISMLLLFSTWYYLTRIAFKYEVTESAKNAALISNQLKALGRLSKQETRVLIVFVLTAFAWITRSYIQDWFVPGLDDSIIALIAALALLTIPAGENTLSERQLYAWKDTVSLPWGILILFGGGMALASAFESSGLALWIGGGLTAFEISSLFVLVLLLVAGVNFLTEFTSNMATTAMLLPILPAIAITVGIHPYLLMIGTTLAASCAFMLPVSTPPNAIVFGSGFIEVKDMAKAGIWLNLVSILLITLMVYFGVPLLWDLT